ncbi:hypothetical protein TNCV_864251 [Trichonephila clavipes]|nr:hypothetical protein TNCV_864251 [Trichonephila clavipes]
MDGAHLLLCTGLEEYSTDDVVCRYWKARRQMVKKPSTDVVSDRGLPCHEFEPSTTKDPPSEIYALSSKHPPQKIRFNKGRMLKMVIVYKVLLFSVQIIPHPPLPQIQRAIYYKIAFEDFFFGS